MSEVKGNEGGKEIEKEEEGKKERWKSMRELILNLG